MSKGEEEKDMAMPEQMLKQTPIRETISNNKPIRAKKTDNSTANKSYASKNKISLTDFMAKTGKSLPKVDEDGNWIIDRDNPNQNRWLED